MNKSSFQAKQQLMSRTKHFCRLKPVNASRQMAKGWVWKQNYTRTFSSSMRAYIIIESGRTPKKQFWSF